MPTNANATGVWTAQLKNSAKQGRQLMQALFAANDTLPMNGTRSGVLTTTDGRTDLLGSVSAGLVMAINPGFGVAYRSGQALYVGWLEAATTVTLDAAPGSNPRNDVVFMRMYDATIGGDSPPGGVPCRIEVLTGTPAASPTDLMTPNTQGVYTGFADGLGGVGIPLLRVRVNTNATTVLTDIRRGAALTGAVRKLLPGDSDVLGVTGDFRYNPVTDLLDIRDSGGNFQVIRKGADVGGEWASNAAQAIAAAGPTALQFPTNTVAPVGLTFNGSDTWTVQTTGLYSSFCQMRIASAQNGGIAMGATSYADATHILPFLGFTGGPDYGLSGTVRLTAGQQFKFWFYNNGSASSINNALRPAMAKVWKQQGAA